MNQVTRQAVTVIVTLLVLIGLGVAADNYNAKHPGTTGTQTQSQAQNQTASISYSGQDGKTVLELLQGNHKVETKDSSYGTFVTSIDGKAGTDNAAWIYYVDGKQGTVGANEAQTTHEQTIEWRYETF